MQADDPHTPFRSVSAAFRNRIASPEALSVNIAETFAATEAQRNAARHQPDYFLNDHLGRAYMAISAIILAFSYLFPVVPILILYAIWLPLPFVKGIKMLWPDRSLLWAASLSLLAILSALWSDYPHTSLYLGVALLSTILCVVIANRTVRFRPFIEGLLIGIAVCMAITLMSGIKGSDVFSNEFTLIGYFGSKNMVGTLASFGMLLSVALIFLERFSWRSAILCGGTFLLCADCLLQSKSATSLVAVALSLTAMGWATLMRRLPRSVRLFIFAASLLLVVLAAAGTVMDEGKTLLNALGKDATLTGRTYLWHEGYTIAQERPALGHGYAAFWVPGNPRAERYWYEFGITAGTGFHFHNTYIQTFVDLGLLGMLLVIAQLFTVLLRSAAFALSAPQRVEGALLLGFALMFVIRSFVEIDITGTFTLTSFLFYTINLRLTQLRQMAAPALKTA